MITGRVFRRRPTVLLTVSGPKGQLSDLEFIVDTGVTGYLTLPLADVAALGLPFTNYFDAGLADGSRVRVTVHEATILWHGARQTVLVLATGQRPLLGMSLVYGCHLALDGKEGGVVTIDPLP